MEYKDVFISGEEGYKFYRIPVIIRCKSGRIIAFCEGRKNSVVDYGEIDIVAKISDDGGKTFGQLKVCISGNGDTAGNQCPIIDEETGRMCMVFCTNLHDGGEELIMQGKAKREVFVTFSDDEGESFSEPVNITSQVMRDGWSWYATGPCHSIVSGGRYIIPCNHGVLEENKTVYTASHIIYSDDKGKNWSIGAIAEPKTNESTVAMLPNGDIYFNMRNLGNRTYRVYALSRDNGITFGETYLDEALIDPYCQGSVLSTEKGLLFSNCASADKRISITVRFSEDNGASWCKSILLNEGFSAYSDLALTKDGRIVCLYENGQEGPYEKITATVFGFEELKQ